MTVLGCIADDFTGATDLAAMLARTGVTVSLRLGLPQQEPDGIADVEIVALKIRTVPVSDATRQAVVALDWLRRAEAEQFYWKYCSTFDSTETGNIGPVAQTLMGALEAEQTVYIPSFPENGRRVFMGNLFVGRDPIGESPMKDHPLTPMTDSNLCRVLAPQLDGAAVGLVDWPTVARGPMAVRNQLDTLLDEDIRHVIVDAIADHDLEAIARACQTFALLTGGSAFAAQLPPLWRERGLIDAEPNEFVAHDLPSGGIVLSGSCSAMTQEQIAMLLPHVPSLKLDPIVIARNGAGEARDWLANQATNGPVLIYATADADEVRFNQQELGTERAGEIVETTLAQLAADAREMGRARFIVAGGETSGAVAQVLGIDRLLVGPEIAPGVPWTFSDDGAGTIALALKSGNFGGPDFFLRALDLLDRLEDGKPA